MLPSCPAGFDGSKYAAYATLATTQAAVLRSAAARIDSAISGVGRTVSAAKFSSPSANRFKHRMGDLDDGLRGSGRRLDQLAAELDKMAKHYQDLYDAWRADQQAAKEAAKKAAAAHPAPGTTTNPAASPYGPSGG